MDRDELLDPKGIRGEALGDDELIRDLEAIEEEEEAGIDDELARASLSERLQGLSDFPGERVVMGEAAPLRPIGPGVVNQDNPYMGQGGLRDIDPRTEQRLAAARESMRLRDNERSSDNMRERVETLERLRREGGFDPFTGEYVDSDRQQRIDAAFDEDFMRDAFTDEERAAEAENARLDALDRARAQGSGIPLRVGGPRVQARGGKNPKMADLMKKVKAKYGIR